MLGSATDYVKGNSHALNVIHILISSSVIHYSVNYAKHILGNGYGLSREVLEE